MAMRRTRVKICGLTRPQDVRFAVDAGVDAIGLVCYPPSKRYLSPDDATRLRAGIPAFVSTVCLFVDPAPDEVRLVMDQVRPDLLQFHGDESAEFCRQFNVPYLKAFRVGAPGLDTAHKLASHCLQYPDAGGWLFDSYSPGFGGSGLRLDAALLQELPRGPEMPVMVLSGGLTADTVLADISRWSPYAVDVSSGVEQSPGIKDPDRIRAFMQAVHATAVA